MSDLIHLLPDSIANQIAAGEVIQRPASIVKELVENAIDANASNIKVIIKDAGRTFIQIIDDGKGMSNTDARLAFERHATSKISSVDDLFSLKTMGFRGEALPSIAAISQVELKTKQEADEIGTHIVISASKVESQECTACPTGSNFLIKNIFFNVPARRKFLKSNDTERKNIITELERIALVNPEIEFTLVDNDTEIIKYLPGSLKQRIVSVIGKNFNQQLIPIEIETGLGRISGYIGKPESARKTRALQYFFVNGRYMRHAYFNKAVATAYEALISAGESPNYFIYFDVDPSSIDVNIHPTKTEIKFENEQPLWQILNVTIKEALGKSNEVPTIDFDTKDSINIPVFDNSITNSKPQVRVNTSYNPFNVSSQAYGRPDIAWESLYEGFDNEENKNTYNHDDQTKLYYDEETVKAELAPISYQYKNKYILTSAKSGLMVIDQRRAHIRILFDRFLTNILNKKGVSQRVLFPEIIEFSASEAAMIPYLMEDFEAIGFSISNLGNNAYAINGVPSEIENANPTEIIHSMLSKSIDTGSDVKEEIQEIIALSMAQATAITHGQRLTSEEITELIDNLFASPKHNYTPDGKTIISVIADNDIDKLFK